MDDNQDRQQHPAIRDSRLKASDKFTKKQNDAQLEHEHTLATREQSHAHLIDKDVIQAITNQVWWTRFGSFSLCIVLLVLISSAVILVTLEQFQVSPGLGFTLGIITSVLAAFFQKLVRRMWDFRDLHQLLNRP